MSAEGPGSWGFVGLQGRIGGGCTRAQALVCELATPCQPQRGPSSQPSSPCPSRQAGRQAPLLGCAPWPADGVSLFAPPASILPAAESEALPPGKPFPWGVGWSCELQSALSKMLLFAFLFMYIHTYIHTYIYIHIYIIYLFIFTQRGREGEREGEKHQCVAASRAPPTGDLARNPGMCPDWESNQRPFGVQVGTQSTEPRQPGLFLYFFMYLFVLIKVCLAYEKSCIYVVRTSS